MSPEEETHADFDFDALDAAMGTAQEAAARCLKAVLSSSAWDEIEDERAPFEDGPESSRPSDEPDGCADNLAACPRHPCECLELAQELHEAEHAQSVQQQAAALFPFAPGDIVRYSKHPRFLFVIHQRFWDIDATSHGRHYTLRVIDEETQKLTWDGLAKTIKPHEETELKLIQQKEN